jgi:uncharacterized protein (TIRG00374 family)
MLPADSLADNGFFGGSDTAHDKKYFRLPIQAQRLSRSEVEGPFCVDLDGTLIRNDLSIESLFSALWRSPWIVFLIPGWLLRGRQVLKAKLAQRVELRPETLPFNAEVIKAIEEARATGRRTVLVTGSHYLFAQLVADHLGVFDDVHASDESVNLTGCAKADKLVSLYGEGNFEYAGNAAVDLPVWAVSGSIMTVNAPRRVIDQVRKFGKQERHLSDARPSLKTWVRQYLTPVYVSVAVSMVLYLAAILLTDGAEVVARLRSLPAGFLVMAVALPTLAFLFRFLRWDYYLRALGHALPPARHLQIYLAGFSLTATPGKVGENLRALYLRPRGVPMSHSVAAFTAERLGDLVAMLLLSGLAFGLVGEYRWALVGSVAVTLAGLVVMRHPGVAAKLQSRADDSRWAGRALAGVGRALAAASTLLSPRLLTAGVGIALLAWGAEALTFALIAREVGIEIPVLAGMGIFAVATLHGGCVVPAGGRWRHGGGDGRTPRRGGWHFSGGRGGHPGYPRGDSVVGDLARRALPPRPGSASV